MLAACSTATANFDHPGLRRHSEFLIISVADQVLYHYRENRIYKEYPVSTSEYGIGSLANSDKTPLGLHLIKRKYGDGAPLGFRFVGRQSTGEISPIYRDDRRSESEDILTRIMHLSGLEPGINQGGSVDSYNRYIYIHGTSE